jgi:hypothetical protein
VPRWALHPDLGSGQVVTPKQPGKVLTLRTALVERVCLRLRQLVAVFHAFYTVARPPYAFRQPLPRHARTRPCALCPRWRAGVTDRVWTFRELRTAKFALLDSQSISRKAPKRGLMEARTSDSRRRCYGTRGACGARPRSLRKPMTLCPREVGGCPLSPTDVRIDPVGAGSPRRPGKLASRST